MNGSPCQVQVVRTYAKFATWSAGRTARNGRAGPPRSRPPARPSRGASSSPSGLASYSSPAPVGVVPVTHPAHRPGRGARAAASASNVATSVSVPSLASRHICAPCGSRALSTLNSATTSVVAGREAVAPERRALDDPALHRPHRRLVLPAVREPVQARPGGPPSARHRPRRRRRRTASRGRRGRAPGRAWCGDVRCADLVGPVDEAGDPVVPALEVERHLRGRHGALHDGGPRSAPEVGRPATPSAGVDSCFFAATTTSAGGSSRRPTSAWPRWLAPRSASPGRVAPTGLPGLTANETVSSGQAPISCTNRRLTVVGPALAPDRACSASRSSEV